MSKVWEGQLSAAGLRFVIIVSRFNSFITDRLLAGAMDALTRTGAAADLIEIVKVPGPGDPAGGRRNGADAHRYDAVICLSRADPRRHAALRLHCRRSRQGHRARQPGDGRPGVLRRADTKHAGAGHRPGRRQGGNKGSTPP